MIVVGTTHSGNCWELADEWGESLNWTITLGLIGNAGRPSDLEDLHLASQLDRCWRAVQQGSAAAVAGALLQLALVLLNRSFVVPDAAQI